MAQGQDSACRHVTMTSDTVCSSLVALSPCVHLRSWTSHFSAGGQLLLTQQKTQCWPDLPWVDPHITQPWLSSAALWFPPILSVPDTKAECWCLSPATISVSLWSTHWISPAIQWPLSVVSDWPLILRMSLWQQRLWGT